jgi:CheY-like chemotaxis protein
MESLAVLPDLLQPGDEPIGLLIADGDPDLRALLARSSSDAVKSLAVHEAADGPEAVQLGLQRRPQLALLDVDLPRLGGIEVSLVLRELLPGLRLALQARHPDPYADSARELSLPLFDKRDSTRALRWLERQARNRPRPRALRLPGRL